MSAARKRRPVVPPPNGNVRADLDFATAALAKLRGQLAESQDALRGAHLIEDQLRKDVTDLRRDLANVSDALAEATWLLDRCTPGRFRDRELAPRIRAFSELAGREANAKVRARIDKLPTLGTPSSAMGKACGHAPPAMYAETHAGCSFVAGHGGDHLWKSTAFDVTGQHDTNQGG